MINHFCKKPLWECSEKLADVAAGRKEAELLIIHARLVNVCTHEIQKGTFVGVAEGRIAFVGLEEETDYHFCIGKETKVIDAKEMFLAPGFMDGHIHVESSMMCVGEYAKAVIPHGTTAIYMDPHEICNVLGLDGVKWMMEDAARTPLKAMLTTPSCVPTMPGLEDTGAVIDVADITETMNWNCCVGLGEMMNFPDILNSTGKAHEMVAETLKAGKIVTGHYAMPETGMGLNAYIASGIRCCHESTRKEDALAKMRRGMYAQLREGSAWHDLKEVAKSITQHKIDSRYACLVSDDAHPHTLFGEGHLDHILRRAMEEGIDPITAIQMVTINCAQCFQVDHELGSITPGKCADMVLLENLDTMKVMYVWIDGNLIAKEGQMMVHLLEYQYPYAALHSVHLSGGTTIEDFEIGAPDIHAENATAHVIEIIPERVGTIDKQLVLPVEKGMVKADVSQDVLKAAVFERHERTGKIGLGFVKGFGITHGAIASTVSHDAHNLMVIGSHDDDMELAANVLLECNGGMVVVSKGEVLELVELPIAGLMNILSCEEMSSKLEKLENAWKKIGCEIESPFMTMALVALACLPEIRLTNRGLIDCTTFSFLKLFMDKDEK